MGRDINKTNYADEAEKVIKSLITTDRRGKDNLALTTSKIRNILTLTNELSNQGRNLREDKLNESIKSSIQYVKMRFAYESGREPKSVGEFVKKADIMNQISLIGDSKERLMLFCNYVEALVAYHKFYGEID